MRDWRPGRFSNAMRGFKHTSDELNKMDIDNQTYKANQGKASNLKHKTYGISNEFYHAFEGFEDIFIDNIFWGDADKDCIEKLKMIQRQLQNLYNKLRKIYPNQIKEDIGGAWWGFKNRDKYIKSLEIDKDNVDRHFSSIDTTNEEIDKATRLLDIMSNLMSEFMEKYTSCGSEHTRERNDYKYGLEKAQDFYDEVNRYKDQLKAMKDEIGEKYWTRDGGEKNEDRKRTYKVYMTEAQLRSCIHRAVKKAYRILKEDKGWDSDTEWRKEFMDWATEEHNHPSIDTVGLMYSYYTEDDDDAFLELIEEFGNEIDKDLTDDSQESNWIIDEIRRAINEWGYYNCNEDNDEYDEEEDL